ncbi:MAG: lamin tail domain-containing protein [Chloroflexota bacterium]
MLRHLLAGLLLLLCLNIVNGMGGETAVASPVKQESIPPLLITEVYYHAPGPDEDEEWIELAYFGTEPLDISSYKLGDEAQSGGSEGMMRFPDGAVMQPEQVIVVAQTAVGFRSRFGFNPDYEMRDTDADVPVMVHYSLWAAGRLLLANRGDDVLLLDEHDQIVDAISYGDSTTFFSPAVAPVFQGHSLERIPAHCDTDSAADWQPQREPTPGRIIRDGECAPPPPEALLPIGAIQGPGNVSPHINQIVSFRGVVTGIHEDQNASGTIYYTLFVQDLPGLEDGDPATSDGIAVFTGRQQPAARPGDQVRVTGQVIEFFGLTEISDRGLTILVEESDLPLPEPIIIDPPADNAAQAEYFERLEGMRVAFAGPVNVVGPSWGGCSFAVAQAAERVVYRAHEVAPVGQVVPILHHSKVSCDGFPEVKVGDEVSGIVGPLTYHFDQFKIVQQAQDEIVVRPAPMPPLPTPPAAAPDQFTVVSFNVENYFDHIDDTGLDAEPKPTLAEIEVKQTKLAFALTEIVGCPTVVGVQEVEKGVLLEQLAAITAGGCGFTYQVVHQESADIRGIDVAYLVDPRRVTVISAQLEQSCTGLNTNISDPTITCSSGQEPLFSRPPLAMEALIDGHAYIFYVNHFKSKLGDAAETAARRLAQAQHINALVAAHLAQDGGARIVVIGDFNDYERSLPLLAMTEQGQLTNVLSRLPEAERYSFSFGGAAQLIDGLLVSPALVEAVTWVGVAHVNADFPSFWATDVSPERIGFRSSDHDYPLIMIRLPAVEAVAAPGLEAVDRAVAAPGRGANGLVWGLLLLLAVSVVGGTAVIWWRRAAGR